MYKSEELRVAMARRNVNNAEVAEMSGVHVSTVSLIVNDKAHNVQINTLKKVANAVGLNVRVEFDPASVDEQDQMAIAK